MEMGTVCFWMGVGLRYGDGHGVLLDGSGPAVDMLLTCYRHALDML